MARGINSVFISGNVGNDNCIRYGETGNGDAACSFMLAIERKKDQVLWIRVNAYGNIVHICRERLRQGIYVVIEGQLMSRIGPQSQNDLVEVRAEEVVFLDTRA